MAPEVFGLVLFSAALHASWNFAVRSVKGDFAVVWLGSASAAALMSPVGLWLLWNDPSAFTPTLTAVLCVIGTGVSHAAYLGLLARAYRCGEISVIYPVARGTGVGVTAIAALFLFDEPLSALGGLGVLLIVSGVLSLGLPLYRGGMSSSGFGLAIATGVSTSTYTLIDKIGVGLIDPILYVWFLYLLMTFLLIPVFRLRGRGLSERARSHLPHILLVGPGALLTYLIILFAYQLGPVSYIAATREAAVIVGAALGIIFLGERLTVAKGLAICAIAAGLVCIKSA